MSGLTLQTGKSPSKPSQPRSPYSTVPSRSSSPVQPQYSPISPARSPTRKAASAKLSSAQEPPRSQALKTYTHNVPNTTFVSQPLPEPITLEDNPDAIALRSAITILQLQKKRAADDIKTLQKIKQKAVEDPEGFRDALAADKIRSKPDPLFSPQYKDTEEDSQGEDDTIMQDAQEKWADFPARQNVVRCPPINWNQYGVVGESLDKLHADQQRQPITGAPQKIGADGKVTASENGRRQGAAIATPYTPGKDKIEKPKKGKRQ